MDSKDLKKVGDKAQGFGKEFREFISRGNVVDLAVGVIVGGAFSKIVTSLVNDIIMPLVGVPLGGVDLSALTVSVLDAQITYGTFLQNTLDFVIIAFCIFTFVKVVNQIHQSGKTQVEDTKSVKKEDQQLSVLKEIRDHLKKGSFIDE